MDPEIFFGDEGLRKQFLYLNGRRVQHACRVEMYFCSRRDDQRLTAVYSLPRHVTVAASYRGCARQEVFVVELMREGRDQIAKWRDQEKGQVVSHLRVCAKKM